MRADSRQRRWENERLSLIPASVARILRRGHTARLGERGPASTSPWYIGNQWLARETNTLRAAHIWKAFDEAVIRDTAENHARVCARLPTLDKRATFAHSQGIAAPDGPTMTAGGKLLRLADAQWWRRGCRKAWTRGAEQSMRALGVVRRQGQVYVSDEAVRWRTGAEAKQREFLESHELVSDEGAQLSLLEVAEKSQANPKLRRGELMVRARGFQELAEQHHHGCDFWTLTAPSAFHPHVATGGPNPRYQGFTAREAQAWLMKHWARARAWCKRKGVLVYGFRVAEPHHDGTPHWHLALFGRVAHLDLLQQYLRRLWLRDYADEPGASRVRTSVIRMDPAHGEAVGYLAKYIGKNIDGEGFAGSDAGDEGGMVMENTRRVKTWATLHGIRQFQQIGGPAVGLYREARRLREPHADPDLEHCRQAADAGEWARFVNAVGGIHAGRRTNLRLEKAETGELNKYGELRAARTVGLRYASTWVLTRLTRWRVQKCAHTAGGGSPRSPCFSRAPASDFTPASANPGDFSALTLDLFRPWTRGNNCTGAPAAGEPSSWTNPHESSQGPP